TRRRTSPPVARLAIDRSRNVSSPGPIHTTRSADWIARASDGRNAYAWGELPPGTSRRGSPTPRMTAATSEWTGAMVATTTGGDRSAGVPVPAADGTCHGRNEPSAIAAVASAPWIQREIGIRRFGKER